MTDPTVALGYYGEAILERQHWNGYIVEYGSQKCSDVPAQNTESSQGALHPPLSFDGSVADRGQYTLCSWRGCILSREQHRSKQGGGLHGAKLQFGMWPSRASACWLRVLRQPSDMVHPEAWIIAQNGRSPCGVWENCVESSMTCIQAVRAGLMMYAP
eukprot:116344-Amphidinium_carterae.1